MSFHKRLSLRAILIIGLFSYSNVFAANIYVDKTLTSTCSGNYNTESRNCTGNSGDAYKSLQSAVNSMSPGDHIVLRGGTYNECVNIPTSKNGTSWDEGSYNKIESCNTESGCTTNEWAVLDGNSSCSANNGAVLGHPVFEEDGRGDLKYWMLERLEITGGGGNNTAYGFWGNGGPFWLRYNYIHDNIAANCNNLPAGTWGHLWHDSIIEYNWYADNGGTAQNNCKQIGWIGSYSSDNTMPDYGTMPSGVYPDINNIIQYNLVVGGNVGIGIKHHSSLTSRNVRLGNGYDDTRKDQGTEIHHNILNDQSGYSIGAHGDFYQVHHNIIDGAGENAIRIGYTYPGYWMMYKVSVYNNTMMNIAHSEIMGYFTRDSADYEQKDYKYVYNNIVDGGGVNTRNCGYETAFTPQIHCSSDPLSIDYSNHIISHNYSYRPVDPRQYNIDDTAYTASEWESQTITTSPSAAYTSAYDPGNLLYKDTTGANKYITRGDHEIEPGITIANGGYGRAHPYLNVSIPSYIGATNPQDTGWVYGLLSLATKVGGIPVTLRDATPGNPNWHKAPPKPPTPNN